MAQVIDGIEYEVNADTKGLSISVRKVDEATGRMERGLNRTEKASKRLEKSLGALSAVAASVISTITLSRINASADTMIRLSNRIRTVTTSEQERAEVQRALGQIANQTNSTLESTVELYARLARNTTELGLSQAEILGVTKSLNQAFQLGGASAQEAAAATIQLSQALASGTLRGDEFNSVAEQAPLILEALAKQTGRTRGDLRAMAAEGRLTARVLIEAITGAAEQWDEEFQGLQKTSQQTFTVLTNNANTFVNQLNQSIGFTDGLNTLLLETAAIFSALTKQTDQMVEGLEAGFAPVRALVALIQEGPEAAAAILEQASQFHERMFSGAGLDTFLDNLKQARQELGLAGGQPLEISITGGDTSAQMEEINLVFDTFESRLRQLALVGDEVGVSIGNALGDAAATGVDRVSVGLANAVANGESLGDAVKEVARSVAVDLLASMIKIGIQAAIGQATVTAAATAQGAAIASAMAPAAALTSLATNGANAVPAQAGIAATVAQAQGLSLLGGRQYGGPTNAGGIYQTGELNRPEMLTEGGKQYLIPGNRGNVTPLEGMGGTTNVSVTVNNLPGQDARVSESGSGPDRQLVIDIINAEALNPGSRLNQNLRKTNTLSPRQGATRRTGQ